MNKDKQLASRMSVMLVAAMVAASSAFAESRRSEGTSSRSGARDTVRRGTVTASGQSGRSDGTRNRATVESRSSRRSEGAAVQRRSAGSGSRGEGRATERRSDGRSHGRTYERRDQGSSSRRRNEGSATERRNDNRNGGTYERRNDNRNGGTYERRNDNRNRGSYDRRSDDRNRGSYGRGNGRNDGRWNGNHRNGGNRNGSYGNRQHYYHHGRISNWHRYGGGYRVWIVGAPYPYYVPLAYWHADRFRIGLSIGLGGYYNDLGYYDYYDGYRDGVRAGYDNDLHSDADFRGVVESVDWRRDTFVVRNEDTGSFITVVLRDRREGDVRVGDFVAVRGDWTTRGVFHAYDVDLLD